MAEPAAKYSEPDEQQERCEHSPIEGANPRAGMVKPGGDDRPRDPHSIDHDPDNAAIARRKPGRDVACENQRAPHDHDEAGEVVDSRLPDAADDLLDVAQGFAGLFAVDHEGTP